MITIINLIILAQQPRATLGYYRRVPGVSGLFYIQSQLSGVRPIRAAIAGRPAIDHWRRGMRLDLGISKS